MRVAELRARVQPPTSNLYDAVFTRTFSILITAAVAPLGVTANQVSFVNLFVGVGACALIAFSEVAGAAAGVLLVHLYAILDSVDGELARLRKNFSLKGLYLEDLSAFYVIVGFPLATGIYVYRHGGGSALLVLAVVYASFGRNGMAVARRAILRSIGTKRPISRATAGASVGTSRVAAFRRFVDGQLLNHTNIRVVVSTVFLVEAAMGGSLGATRLLLSIVLVGLLAREVLTIVYLFRGRTLDDMLLQAYDDAKTVNTDATQADGFHLARY